MKLFVLILICIAFIRPLSIDTAAKYKRTKSRIMSLCFKVPSREVKLHMTSNYLRMALDVKLGKYHMFELINYLNNTLFQIGAGLGNLALAHATALTDLLLLDGDIHENPGPRKRSLLGRYRKNDLKRARLELTDPGYSNEDTVDSDFDFGLLCLDSTDTATPADEHMPMDEPMTRENRIQATVDSVARGNESSIVNMAGIQETINDVAADRFRSEDLPVDVVNVSSINTQNGNEQTGSAQTAPFDEHMQMEEARRAENRIQEIVDYVARGNNSSSVLGDIGHEIINEIDSDRLRSDNEAAESTSINRTNPDDGPEFAAQPEPEPTNIGTIIQGVKCQYCNALRFKMERSGFCCQHGQFANIPLPLEPPSQIKDLYSDNSFLNNIRGYNNLLALASIGCKEVKNDGFSPVLKIHGKVYHFIGPLTPTEGEKPKYAQLYFHDTNNELANRSGLYPSLDQNKIQQLQSCLHEVNPFVREIKLASSNSDAATELEVVLKSGDTRTTELPTCNEMAGIMNQRSEGNLHVTFKKKSGTVHKINELSKLYDPLHYVLLFPFGDGGYHTKIFDTKSKIISIHKYSRYLLQVRTSITTGNYLVRSRRLTQQYVIDMFAKQENYRMAWFKANQKTIRAEKYNGLVDAVNSNDEHQPGRRIILPASYYGSPRWYAEVFQDAMAIVRKFGKPDLFITFTCNPKWPEITGSLYSNETPTDRPDIICRVFNLKYELLLKMLVKEHCLGRVIAYVSMKEDQKRGMPHTHMLLTMDKDSKPRTPEDVDRIISAEIPDKDTHPVTFKVITTHNIHGPCGDIRHDARCMGADKKCGRKFPRKFNNEGTTFAENGYPQYRRRDTLHRGKSIYRTVKGQTYDIDNRWVVPFSPMLSCLFDCHINVEVVSTIGAVKYVIKYIAKGSDYILYSLQRSVNGIMDETELFRTARYISASEAFWRIFEFEIGKRYPPVKKLAVHLPDEQCVFFDEGNFEESLADGPPITTLTAFFYLNQTDQEAHQFLYTDICQHYRFVNNRWQKRKRQRSSDTNNDSERLSDMIGRIPVINLSPKQSELYYLRMLLHHQKGPTSYEDLRTVNGELSSTFKNACIKLGLLATDDEVDRIMNEGALIQFGDELKDLFTSLLVFGDVTDPVAFWERHKIKLCEDIAFQRGHETPNDEDYQIGLLMIQNMLEAYEMNLKQHFGIDLPEQTLQQMLFTPVPIVPAFDIPFLENLTSENISIMNHEQLNVFHPVMESVNKGLGKCFFINAAGGTGKTFLITTILAAVRAKGEIAIASAISGIAATLLPAGRTLHSALKVPIDIDEYSMCNLTQTGTLASKLRECKVLIVDEVTMAHKHIYEAIDRSLQDIRKNKRHFGGLTVVFSGDWRQILPVVRHGGEAEIVAACLKSSYIWEIGTRLSLSKNMRLIENDHNAEYAEYLLKVGSGQIAPADPDRPHHIPIPIDLQLAENTLDCLCDFVYEDKETNFASHAWICSRGVLSPTNEGADEINSKVVEYIPTDLIYYNSADSVLDESLAYQYPTEYLNSITPSGMPNHTLALKVGAPIMLLRNLDPANHHCNGTRYVITALHERIIEATIVSGPKVGTRKLIPRIPLKTTDKSLPFQMKRVQFPVKLCFGMTINKAQGQTFQKVGVYLKQDVFSHGQLYVALSRVSDAKMIKVMACNDNPGVMKNVVYKEIVEDCH